MNSNVAYHSHPRYLTRSAQNIIVGDRLVFIPANDIAITDTNATFHTIKSAQFEFQQFQNAICAVFIIENEKTGELRKLTCRLGDQLTLDTYQNCQECD